MFHIQIFLKTSTFDTVKETVVILFCVHGCIYRHSVGRPIFLLYKYVCWQFVNLIVKNS